jgi:hypothetical protein
VLIDSNAEAVRVMRERLAAGAGAGDGAGANAGAASQRLKAARG